MTLTQERITENKKHFIELCKENIKREGLVELLNWLECTDFFIAPCSTKYHLSCRGGLCEHSLNVYDMLLKLACVIDIDINQHIESLTIISLFHDVCKADFYQPTIKYVKEGHQWVERSMFEINDDLPLGHGEKSLYLVNRHIALHDDEACAIRWHMGAYDNAFRGGEQAFNTATDKFILVSLLQSADLLASKIIEKS